MTYLVAPFRDRLRHTYEVDLLEGICSQGSDRYLTGNDHYRCGVEHGICHTRQGVCCTRTTGNQCHTYITTHPCKAFCGMCGSLLVANKYMVECFFLASGIVIQGIIYRHDTAAWIAKDGFHPFGFQCQHQCF